MSASTHLNVLGDSSRGAGNCPVFIFFQIETYVRPTLSITSRAVSSLGGGLASSVTGRSRCCGGASLSTGRGLESNAARAIAALDFFFFEGM